MAEQAENFEAPGLTWVQRSRLPELNAVLGPDLPVRVNHFIDAVHRRAARVIPRARVQSLTLIDFGCGTGRFIRFFARRGYNVVGIDITPEMLARAEQIGIPAGTSLMLTDGVSIPVDDDSVDIIWCCGVLRFSLLTSNPVYREIANEMHRVLRPGGLVVNVEVHTAAGAAEFIRDFELSGFVTWDVRVVQRYDGRLERAIRRVPMPVALARVAGTLCALVRSHLDRAERDMPGLRDYRFRWLKPPRQVSRAGSWSLAGDFSAR